MTDPSGDGFAARYPRLHHFFETVLRPEVDGDNLLEMLHRVMRHWHPAFVEELVEELGRLAADDDLTPAELAEQFSRDVEDGYRVVTEANARAMVRTLAEYTAYLYGHEGVRGTSPG
jgi:hypothetical protein